MNFTPSDVTLLKAKIKALADESAELEDRRLCGICCYRPKDVIFLNCGHVFCCSQCANNIQKCPFDSHPITVKLQFKRTDYLGKEVAGVANYNENRISYRVMANLEKDRESWVDTYELLRFEVKKLKKNEYCGICFRRPRECLFMQCGHVFCCLVCSKTLERCPLDQKVINKKVRLFFT